jgi:hypothetical protein
MNSSTASQTELAIDTNMMVADMHRNMFAGQEFISGQNNSVGAVYYSTNNITYYRLGSSQVSDT